MMRVLGIDPGSLVTGFGVVEEMMSSIFTKAKSKLTAKDRCLHS